MLRPGASALACVVGLLASPAAAETVTVRFTAQVASVYDPRGVLGSRIRPADVISGTYSYDTATPDINDAPTVGDYWHTGAAYGISVIAGGLTFRTDPANVDFLVEIVNDHGIQPRDSYLLRSYSNSPLDGCHGTVDHISWALGDGTAVANSSDLLPSVPPDLSSWQSVFGLTLEGGLGQARYQVTAHVTSAILDLGQAQPPVTVAVSDSRDAEGEVASVFVFLSGPSTAPVQVDYRTSNGSATANEDYVSATGTLLFLPGETWKRIPVALRADATREPSEQFSFQLSNPTNVTLTDPLGLVTIVDATATATTVRYIAEGHVTQVVDRIGLLAGAIGPGDPITAVYAFDSAMSDSNSLPTVGDYWHDRGTHGIWVTAGGLNFRTDPANVGFLIELVNDHSSNPMDHYYLQSYVNRPLDGCGASVDRITWQLDDATASAVTSDQLPGAPPVLSDWQSLFGLVVTGGASPETPQLNYHVRAQVTSIVECPSDIRSRQCRRWQRTRRAAKGVSR